MAPKPAPAVAEEAQYSRKYRPVSLGTYLASNETKALVNSIISGATPPSTIGIFGPSGCGKTTLARIIAYGVNRIPIGTVNMDITEHNLSDERGIDSVRAIIKGSNFHPTLRCRVRILDEIHALTPQAVSALLKPLEEPPPGVMWIICTDQPGKLPASILNRCLKISVTRPEPKDLAPLLKLVFTKELPDLGAAAGTVMRAIAENAGGVPREALQLTETFARVWRARDKKEAVDAKLINRLMIQVANASPDMQANKVAVMALVGIYTGNVAQVVRVCADVQQRENLNSLIYKLLDFNLWLLRSVSNVSGGWSNMDTNALSAMLAKAGGMPDASAVARVHQALVDMRVKQSTYAVDENHLIPAVLAGLAADNGATPAASIDLD